jgi:hypothetical protein
MTNGRSRILALLAAIALVVRALPVEAQRVAVVCSPFPFTVLTDVINVGTGTVEASEPRATDESPPVFTSDGRFFCFASFVPTAYPRFSNCAISSPAFGP